MPTRLKKGYLFISDSRVLPSPCAHQWKIHDTQDWAWPNAHIHTPGESLGLGLGLVLPLTEGLAAQRCSQWGAPIVWKRLDTEKTMWCKTIGPGGRVSYLQHLQNHLEEFCVFKVPRTRQVLGEPAFFTSNIFSSLRRNFWQLNIGFMVLKNIWPIFEADEGT